MKWAALIAAMVLPLTIISAGAEEPGYSSMTMAAPMYDELSGYDQARQEVAQQMLEMAITAFALDREWAIEQIQAADNTLYHDGELYVFVLDGSGIFVAHGAMPELVGTSIYDIVDIQGTNIGDLFAENRSPYGKWIEYWWPNPATESPESELKLTWAKTSFEYHFGVGIYP
jgi:signal transduction histidine kinase